MYKRKTNLQDFLVTVSRRDVGDSTLQYALPELKAALSEAITNHLVDIEEADDFDYASKESQAVGKREGYGLRIELHFKGMPDEMRRKLFEALKLQSLFDGTTAPNDRDYADHFIKVEPKFQRSLQTPEVDESFHAADVAARAKQLFERYLQWSPVHKLLVESNPSIKALGDNPTLEDYSKAMGEFDVDEHARIVLDDGAKDILNPRDFQDPVSVSVDAPRGLESLSAHNEAIRELLANDEVRPRVLRLVANVIVEVESNCDKDCQACNMDKRIMDTIASSDSPAPKNIRALVEKIARDEPVTIDDVLDMPLPDIDVDKLMGSIIKPDGAGEVEMLANGSAVVSGHFGHQSNVPPELKDWLESEGTTIGGFADDDDDENQKDGETNG